MHLGGTEVGQVFYGATEIGEGWTWDGAWREVWSAKQITTVTKTVGQLGLPQNVWSPIDWEHTTGDPIVGTAVVVSQSQVALITGAAKAGAYAYDRTDWRITVDGVQVGGVISTGPVDGTVATFPPVSVALVEGAQVRLEMFPTSNDSHRRTVVPDGTFMSIEFVSAYVPPAWLDSRAHRTSEYELPRASWQAVPLTSDYGDPVVGGSIVVSGTATVNITGAIDVRPGRGGYFTVRIVVNGVTVLETGDVGASGGTVFGANNVTLNPGDTVALHAIVSSSAYRDIYAAWLKVDAV